MPDRQTGGIAADRLRAIVERIERMNEEKKGISDDIKEIYAEAKVAGFDTRILRLIIRDRKLDAADVAERDALLELYQRALGKNA